MEVKYGFYVDAQASERSSLTCQGCLLHPPPLVDLAQDCKVLGFFLLINR